MRAPTLLSVPIVFLLFSSAALAKRCLHFTVPGPAASP